MKAHFTGPVRTEWIEDNNREHRVLKTVAFVDRMGKRWTVPEGSVVNGASIPSFLWPVLGSPFVGLYRRASVVHDVFCAIKTRPCWQVHEMFNEAMKADNVPNWKRKLMSFAVKTFGPKW